MSRLARSARLAAAAFAAVLLGACTTQIDALPPSFETLQVMREAGIPPMALGRFTRGPNGAGRSVTIRLSSMKAPKGADFAEFLGATFETELRAAGKLDPAAPVVIEGVLTESRVGEDFAKGGASLGAQIVLRRSGAVIFTREYRVDTRWQSDFIGAIAIPEAFRQYNSLYALLVRKVLSDPDFLAAAKR